MQRCRCGECCKGGNDDPRTASLRIAGSPPSCGRGRAVESRSPRLARRFMKTVLEEEGSASSRARKKDCNPR
jgi:hypothetical protein